MSRKILQALSLAVLYLSVVGCSEPAERHEAEPHKVKVTSPVAKDVVVTEQYVCQIHSRRHIDIRALEGGYLEEIPISEGQVVKQGELMFRVNPTLYKARLDSELAEAQLAQIELNNSQALYEKNMVSDQDVAIAKAKLAKVEAEVELTRAELNFANIKAPFDGIVDRFYEQQGSLVDDGDMLTTLSDNAVMWVYFNVHENRYFEYQDAAAAGENDDLQIELMLANHEIFPHPGKINVIEAEFDSETGNIAFRADFDNPEYLLRHGQTGKILIHRKLKDAIVIPQRATFEILAKRYAYVVDENDVVHQREIEIEQEQDDVFVISEGLEPEDKIVFEGIQQVRDGEKVEYEFEEPDEVLSHLKNKAE